MQITKNFLTRLIISSLLIVDLLFIFNINLIFIRSFLSIVLFLFVPGLLILPTFKKEDSTSVINFVYALGLGLAILMLSGLALNWGMGKFFTHPLVFLNIATLYNLLIPCCLLIFYRHKSSLHINLPQINIESLVAIFYCLVVILLSIFGAIRLNNHQSNTLTMFALSGISIFCIVANFAWKKITSNILVWCVYLISLSLLLMFSLRGWFVTGSDMFIEYQIFQVTKSTMHWSLLNFNHTYNAMLSVTILPTILSSFITISDPYIFKLIYPMIFSFVPVIVFYISSRFYNNLVSFLASIFFVSFSSFLVGIPNYTRMEISLFFFGLVIMSIVDKSLNNIGRKTLFLLFGIVMILSHYSTSYIALSLILFSYIFSLIFRKIKSKSYRSKYPVSLLSLMILFIFMFLWYSQFTGISSGISDFVTKSIHTQYNLFNADVHAENIPLFGSEDTANLINKYLQFAGKGLQNTSSYSLYYVGANIFPNTNNSIFTIISKFHLVSILFLGISILIGLGLYLYNFIRNSNFYPEMFVMGLSSLVMLVLVVLLPFASLDYGMDRLYQQVLVILSLGGVLGGIRVFRRLPQRYQSLPLTCFLIFSLLFYIGYFYEIVGGPDRTIQLDNQGDYYERYYLHAAELESMFWLESHYKGQDKISLDRYSQQKFSTVPALNNLSYTLIPFLMPKNSYVYLSSTNIYSQRAFGTYNNKVISYNTPTDFLEDTKDLIYNNARSEIYK